MNEAKSFPKKRWCKCFSLNLLTEYRTQLMGICAIGVILCHAAMPVNGVVLPKLIKLFFSLGNQGVDVFFFLSGIGMYYSLQKNPPLKEWYLKRFLAVGISYILLAIPFYIWYVADAGGTVFEFFCHLSLIGFWIENFGAWYLAVLIPLYLITPFLGRWIDKSKRRMLVTFAVVFGVFFVCLIGKACTEGVLQNVFSRFLRSTPYFLGYGLGNAIKEKRCISWWICPAFVVSFLVLTMFPNNLGFAYDILYVPIVMILSIISKFICEHLKWIDAALCWCGERSLELYLTNIFLPFMFRALPVWDGAWNKGNYAFYAIVIVLGILISQVVYMVKKKIQFTVGSARS